MRVKCTHLIGGNIPYDSGFQSEVLERFRGKCVLTASQLAFPLARPKKRCPRHKVCQMFCISHFITMGEQSGYHKPLMF